VDRFLRVIGFEKEELADYRCGHGIVDFAIEADYALLERTNVSKWILWSLLIGVCYTFNNREKISSQSQISLVLAPQVDPRPTTYMCANRLLLSQSQKVSGSSLS
jgi:hypothetical protein